MGFIHIAYLSQILGNMHLYLFGNLCYIIYIATLVFEQAVHIFWLMDNTTPCKII